MAPVGALRATAAGDGGDRRARVLVVAAVPRSGCASVAPTRATTRRRARRTRRTTSIAEGFGPGANGPILVVADTTKPGSRAALPRLVAALRDDARRRVGERRQENPAGTAALATLIPEPDPQDKATKRLVHRPA